VLLHGDSDADPGAGPGDTRTLVDLDPHRYCDAAVDGHTCADLHPIDHRYAQAGRQRHLDQHGHQHGHAHTDGHLHSVADPHGNGHPDRYRHGDRYQHPDADPYRNLDPDGHSIANRYADPDPKRHSDSDGHSDRDAFADVNCDRHAHCYRDDHTHSVSDGNNPLCRRSDRRQPLGSGFEGRVKKRRRLGLALTERQQLVLVLILVVLLAASLLYCLGFGSLTLRQVWENVPVPWTSSEPVEEELMLTPVITPTLPLTPTTAPR